MSVKRRLKVISGQRLDTPHLRSVESSVANDFDSAMRGLVTGLNTPYLIRGFNIIIPTSAIPASSLQVQVSDSAILHSTAAEAGTILSVPAGTVNDILSSSSANVLGAFQNGVPNYVSLAYVRQTDQSTVDNVQVWSQSQQSEFSRIAPIGDVLSYQYVISTSGFSTNLPLYIVGTTNTGAVSYITKAVPSLFRLGRGGAVPDPYYSFDYHSQENTTQSPTDPRREWINGNTSVTPNPVTVSPGDPPAAFLYGDFNISSMKEWMDAMMTRFKEITGSTYWYTDAALPASSPSLFNTWYDSVGSVLTGTGNMSYNLVLETSAPSYGEYESSFTDPEINVGDSYITGVTSGNQATISAFNGNQLIINSLLKSGFIPNEVLYNRRIYRPDLTKYSLTSTAQGSNTIAILQRTALNSNPDIPISSWSFAPLGASATATDITVNFTSAHGLSVGNYVEFRSMDIASEAPNGVYMIKSVPSTTQVIYSTSYRPSGTPGVIGGSTVARLDIKVKHPYMPEFSVESWSYTGTAISLIAPGHSLTTGETVVVYGLVSTTNAPNGRFTITVNPDQSINFTAGATPTGPATVSGATVLPDLVTFLLTVDGATPTDYNLVNTLATAASDTDLVYTIGPSSLPSIPAASGAITLDGVVAISSVIDPAIVNSIAYDAAPVTATGSIVINTTTVTIPSTAIIAPNMTVSGTGIQAGSIVANIIDSTHFALNLNATATNASVALTFTSPSLLVTTASPHGYNTIAGPIDFTIYGNPALSPYITTYTNVSIIYDSPTTFQIVGNSITNQGTYTNSGFDQTYARFPNNPYAGPLQWTSDMIVKGIIGDKYIKIPQSATATGTPLANKFNINGLTGTAYLQNGEVAYVLMERNQLLSAGATYTTIGGSAAVVGSTVPTYVGGTVLCVGDFVKWEDESETQWLRVSNEGYPSLNDGDQLPSNATTFYLITDSGQPPTLAQRPAKAGRMVYTKGFYDVVTVAPHWLVDASADIYWIAIRRDNGSSKSRIYTRALELDLGEVRVIDSPEPANLLVYTGAGSDAAVNPNYSVIDQTGQYQATQSVQVGSNSTDIDVFSRQVTFISSPDLGFQAGDLITKTVGSSSYTYVIDHLVTNLTVVMSTDVSTLSPGDSVVYSRVDYVVRDPDNLTLGIRKEDRELAKVNTALTRPIYDENVYLQQINLNAGGGAVFIKSGSFIYKGTQSSPTALAWVLHGTSNQTETIEGFNIGMPGGKFGATSILVNIITGSFLDGDTIFQNGASSLYTVNNPGNPAFVSPAILATSNVEIVLPPNKRTQTVGSSYVVWPTNASYKASLDSNLAGEELLVIANDSIRQANLDYIETYGGPKGKIEFARDLPANTRMRFRCLPSYGSALIKTSGAITMQLAYDGGNIVSVLPGRPASYISGDGITTFNVTGDFQMSSSNVGGVSLKGSIDRAFNVGTSALRANQVWAAMQNIKTNTGYTGSQATQFTAAGTSTTTAAFIIPNSNITLVTGQAANIVITGVARRSEGVTLPTTPGAASFRLEGCFYNNGATAAAGSPYSLIGGAYGDGISYALTFGVSGNDVVAVAFGENAAVEWAINIEVQMVSLPT
jgi:hypothetical protein